MARIKIGNIKGPVGPTGQTGKTGPIGPIGPAGPLPPLADNFATTQAGVAALDAAAGKRLNDGLDQVNSEIEATETNLATLDGKHTKLRDITNVYVLDYLNSGELRFCVDGGELYISVAGGTWLGKVALTPIGK